jgi:hypothetical protein
MTDMPVQAGKQPYGERGSFIMNLHTATGNLSKALG